MKFLRNHWYDLGGFFALFLIVILLLNGQNMSFYQLLMCLSLLSLFLHQLEEYRIVGTFPGMVNMMMFKSQKPDRYPLNAQSAVFVNVFMGWTTYFLAIVFAEKAIWLGMATILISTGNIIAHSFIFNIKGKTFYNAGMATSVLLFLPLSIMFFYIIHTEHLVQASDYFIGILLGILLNYAGVIKIIMWLKEENSPYHFPKRCLLKEEKTNHYT
ncbi:MULTISPECIES: HXXEE domain-containing protein [unclassified Lentimicrobium]|uniref:HXXEE domain-containing protein n=1 Tax=unclassified Lentimicrobium TaxID=2677434 RepID=UPI0015556575|nr:MULTISPECIES: HXXEE domain-containing protein [unclassified Lentimicrobium]NPD46424.1 HXXEE domain-containing protein [Lentimicrobium sp. S6]NPD84935.1 HXXEE domain-containing protein [Lentimicrobium sp. L6]